MKKLRVLFVLVISFLGFTTYVSADVCDNAHISQLKKLAEQVDVSYEYLDYSNTNIDGESEFSTDVYAVSVNLVSDDLYIIHGNDSYYYNQAIDGNVKIYVNSGSVDLKVYSKSCADYKLRSISLKLPKFNSYSYKEECRDLEEYELDVCDPWYQGLVNDNIFYEEVNEYIISDEDDGGFSFQDIIDFLGDNYLYVGGGLVLILLIIIGIIVYRKRSVLE